MATLPDWKLQRPVRRRQEKAAVRGQEQSERDQPAQKPAQKQGLLERLHVKPGVPVAEAGLGNEAIGDAPPEPDKPVVILEAIRPVHQDPFNRQVLKKQRRWQRHRHAEKQLTDRRPPEGQGHISGEGEAQEQRPSPAETQEQNLVRRESREQKLSLGKAGESLGGAEVGEQSLRASEAFEWGLSPKEIEERSPELIEAQQWKKSSGEAQEQNGKPAEPEEQTSGGCEMGEWRLGPGEESKRHSGESKTEQRLMQRKSRESLGLLETQKCQLNPREFQEPSSGVMEAPETRLNLGEDGEKSSRQMEGQKWRMNSGKALEQSPGRSEAQEQKPVSSGSRDKKLGVPEVETGEGRIEVAEEEAGNKGEMVSSSTKLPPLKEVVSRNPGPQHHLPPLVFTLLPAPPTSQPSGLSCLLFHGTKSRSRVGVPCHSRHSRKSRPQAASAPPKPQISDPRKKQYPTAEEILVLGGYVCLSRSCLAKRSPERHLKQLKISFNESALETIYYYPSENSVLEDLGLYPEV